MPQNPYEEAARKAEGKKNPYTVAGDAGDRAASAFAGAKPAGEGLVRKKPLPKGSEAHHVLPTKSPFHPLDKEVSAESMAADPRIRKAMQAGKLPGMQDQLHPNPNFSVQDIKDQSAGVADMYRELFGNLGERIQENTAGRSGLPNVGRGVGELAGGFANVPQSTLASAGIFAHPDATLIDRGGAGLELIAALYPELFIKGGKAVVGGAKKVANVATAPLRGMSGGLGVSGKMSIREAEALLREKPGVSAPVDAAQRVSTDGPVQMRPGQGATPPAYTGEGSVFEAQPGTTRRIMRGTAGRGPRTAKGFATEGPKQVIGQQPDALPAGQPQLPQGKPGLPAGKPALPTRSAAEPTPNVHARTPEGDALIQRVGQALGHSPEEVQKILDEQLPTTSPGEQTGHYSQGLKKSQIEGAGGKEHVTTNANAVDHFQQTIDKLKEQQAPQRGKKNAPPVKTPVTKAIANAAREATYTLDPITLSRVEDYQQGVSLGHQSGLDRIAAHPERGPSMRAHFEGVRQAIRAKFGNTIRLYRAEDTVPGVAGKPLTAWTHDPEVAKRFMAPGKTLLARDIPVDDIFAVIKKSDKGGERPLEFLVENKPTGETNATQEGLKQESNLVQHQGNDVNGPPTEPGRGGKPATGGSTQGPNQAQGEANAHAQDANANAEGPTQAALGPQANEDRVLDHPNHDFMLSPELSTEEMSAKGRRVVFSSDYDKASVVLAKTGDITNPYVVALKKAGYDLADAAEHGKNVTAALKEKVASANPGDDVILGQQPIAQKPAVAPEAVPPSVEPPPAAKAPQTEPQPTQRAKAARPVKDIKADIKATKAEIFKAMNKGTGANPLVDPDLWKPVLKLARLEVEAGVSTAEDLIGKMMAHLSELGVKATREDVSRIISGEDRPASTPRVTKDPLAPIRQEIKDGVAENARIQKEAAAKQRQSSGVLQQAHRGAAKEAEAAAGAEKIAADKAVKDAERAFKKQQTDELKAGVAEAKKRQASADRAVQAAMADASKEASSVEDLAAAIDKKASAAEAARARRNVGASMSEHLRLGEDDALGDFYREAKSTSEAAAAEAAKHGAFKIGKVTVKYRTDRTAMSDVRGFIRASRLASVANRIADVTANMTSTVVEKGAVDNIAAMLDRLYPTLRASEGAANGFVSPKMVSDAISEGHKQWVNEIIQLMQKGDADQLAKYGFEQGTMKPWEYVGRATGTTDIPFRDFVHRVVKAELKKANPTLSNARLEAIVANEELEGVFMNKNWVGTQFKRMEAWANTGNRAQREMKHTAMLALDIVAPFPKVLSNLAGRAVDYSPVGFTRGAGKAILGKITKDLPLEQRRVANKLMARGLVGTGVMTSGYFAARAGKNVPDEIDPRSGLMKWNRNTEQAGGPLMNVYNFGSALSIATDPQYSFTPEERGKMIISAVKALWGQPAISGVVTTANLLDPSKAENTAGSVAGRIVASAVPSQLRKNTAVDPSYPGNAWKQWVGFSKEDDKRPQGFKETVQGSVTSNVLGLGNKGRQDLPDKGPPHPELGRYGVTYTPAQPITKNGVKIETKESLAQREVTRRKITHAVIEALTNGEGYKKMQPGQKRVFLQAIIHTINTPEYLNGDSARRSQMIKDAAKAQTTKNAINASRKD